MLAVDFKQSSSRCDLPNTANVPVLVEYSLVNEFTVNRVLEVGPDDELAKVNLAKSAQYMIHGSIFTYTRLNCHNGARGDNTAESEVGEELVGVLTVLATASVVGVHAEMVAETMGEEGGRSAGSKNLVLVTLEDAEGQEAVNGNGVGEDVELVVVDAALEARAGLVLHLEGNVVNLSGFLGELAADGECAGLEPGRRMLARAQDGACRDGK